MIWILLQSAYIQTVLRYSQTQSKLDKSLDYFITNKSNQIFKQKKTEKIS